MSKAILVLVLLALLGLVAFAYLGDLTPETQSVTEPVSLDAD